MREHLFTLSPADLEDAVVLRNLSEPDAGKIPYDSFKAAMNALTIQETGSVHIEDRIRLRETRPSAPSTGHSSPRRSPSSQNRRRGPLRRL